MSDLYFNEQSQYSEENTSKNEEFNSTILQPIYFELEQKNGSYEKETTELVFCRKSFAKYVLLKILINLEPQRPATLLRRYSNTGFFL